MKLPEILLNNPSLLRTLRNTADRKRRALLDKNKDEDLETIKELANFANKMDELLQEEERLEELFGARQPMNENVPIGYEKVAGLID